MTPAQLLAATAADMRKVADAAPPAPWDFNSYSAVFSGPLMRDYDPWSGPIIDEGHTLEHVGDCEPCGTWREPLPCGVPWSRSHGCRHSAEEYERDPLVAKVPASAGDTSHGNHKAGADHIAAWDPDMVRAIADWLDGIPERHTWPGCACQGVQSSPCAEYPAGARVCDAWWKSRGIDPQAKEQQ